VSAARDRRMLDDHIAAAREHRDTVAAAISAGGSELLMAARTAAGAYVRALEAVRKKHEAQFGELTPVQVPTSRSSSNFKAVDATRHFDEAREANKGRPLKDEP
jgi:hypothetical protein